MPRSNWSGAPTFTESMNVYCPAGITNAFGGVENGDMKQSDAAKVTAKSIGSGLTPYATALCTAIGAISTLVAVLEMKRVSNDVVKYIPAISQCGPTLPSASTSDTLTISLTPLFSIRECLRYNGCGSRVRLWSLLEYRSLEEPRFQPARCHLENSRQIQLFILFFNFIRLKLARFKRLIVNRIQMILWPNSQISGVMAR